MKKFLIIIILLISGVNYSQATKLEKYTNLFSTELKTESLILKSVTLDTGSNQVLVRDVINGKVRYVSKSSLVSTQIQPDWNAVSGLGVILNKPTFNINTPSLQEVLTVNQNATDTSIDLHTTSGSNLSLYGSSVSINNATGDNIILTPNSINHYNTGQSNNLSFSKPTAGSSTFFFPDKSTGSYTLATTGDIRPYKVYTALMSQSGTSAPTVIILENTIGSIVWTRNNVGKYFGTLASAFTVNKTFMSTTFNNHLDGNYPISVTIETSGSGLLLLMTNLTNSTGTATDSRLYNTSIEIRVYN